MWTAERDDDGDEPPVRDRYVDGAWGRTANPNTVDGELQNLAAFGAGLSRLSGTRRTAAKVVVWMILVGTAIAILYGVFGGIRLTTWPRSGGGRWPTSPSPAAFEDGNPPSGGHVGTVDIMWRTKDTQTDLPPAKVDKTDEQWRAELTPAEYAVLRKAGTERAFTGEYTDNHREGVYRCRACGAELFRSDHKFDSHCGWPSFFTPLAGERIIERTDNSGGMARTEVLCANCHSHLGHVFSGEGYGTPTDLRYCINSISLTFENEPAS